ncbi:hypothetical protein ACIOHO_23145 [Streptomyces sp. NPDC087849]|uniref:hypothetical protein n=1 Tax=Streptomyces sp. NPDC087849 TaxID=3365808 RepID=UPI00380935E6
MKHPPDRRAGEARARRLAHELSVVERWAIRARTGADPQTLPYRAEESWNGREFAVETRTTNGMHEVVAVARAAPEGRPATDGPQGGAGAVPDPCDEDELAALRSAVRALLDLAGHQEGPARTAVVLTPYGPRVVACVLGSASLGAQGEEVRLRH